MATRTSEAAVRAVLNTALPTEQVTAFISDASLWVTEELSTSTTFAFSAERLELIERYLACALCRLRDLGLKSSTINDVSESYQVDANVTDYLLRAASFDPTGKLRTQFVSPTDRKPAQFLVGTGFRCESPKNNGGLV